MRLAFVTGVALAMVAGSAAAETNWGVFANKNAFSFVDRDSITWSTGNPRVKQTIIYGRPDIYQGASGPKIYQWVDLVIEFDCKRDQERQVHITAKDASGRQVYSTPSLLDDWAAGGQPGSPNHKVRMLVCHNIEGDLVRLKLPANELVIDYIRKIRQGKFD